MRAYCGQTREKKLIARLAAAGIGECTVRGELKSRKRDPWFYDNGAYRDWTAQQPFNGLQFTRDTRRMRMDQEFGKGAPDFVVLPDIVAAGAASLAFSATWSFEVGELPCYVAVQDGMIEADVAAWIDAWDQRHDPDVATSAPLAGIFVGGTLDWKLDTGAAWVAFAHARGLRCHIGRVGTPDRVRWARSIGADSIDSCLPLMYEEHMAAFLAALAEDAPIATTTPEVTPAQDGAASSPSPTTTTEDTMHPTKPSKRTPRLAKALLAAAIATAAPAAAEPSSRPPEVRIHLDDDEVVADNFAGGGGASSGIEWAIGRSPDIAINHDAEAIEMHRANHPLTKHYVEDIWNVDPVEACGGRRVGLLWCSPDCKHFSKAKGATPREQKIRGLAWTATRWAELVRPRVIFLENVEEFQTWGPLDKHGMVIKERRGETFREFVAQLEALGYQVEWKLLRACDYGAPTTRRRLFLVARCDGHAIVWPDPTHGPGRALPYRTAAECIDWSVDAPSIFERQKKHADKTLARIARGVRKFVLGAARPFIVPVQTHGGGGNDPKSLDEPLGTITASKRGTRALVTPYLVPVNHGGVGRNDLRVHAGNAPMPTITSHGRGAHAIVMPHLLQMAGTEPSHINNSARSLGDPMPTVYGEGTHTALVVPYLVHRSNGERPVKVDEDGTVHAGQAPRIYDPEQPLGTIMAQGQKHALVAALLLKHNGGNNDACGASGQPVDEPIHSITGRDSKSLATIELAKLTDPGVRERAKAVAAFLVRYNGKGEPEALTKPLGTLTSRDRYGLVTVEIDGETWVLADIRMRMLTPRELFRAQGFSDSYDIEARAVRGAPLTKTAQVRCVGNSVAPPIAAAIVRAQFGYAALPAGDPALVESDGVLGRLARGSSPTIDVPAGLVAQVAAVEPEPAAPRVGDRVSFLDDQGKKRVGNLVRLTKRQAVIESGGWEWGVSPRHVDKVIAQRQQPPRARRLTVGARVTFLDDKRKKRVGKILRVGKRQVVIAAGGWEWGIGREHVEHAGRAA